MFIPHCLKLRIICVCKYVRFHQKTSTNWCSIIIINYPDVDDRLGGPTNISMCLLAGLQWSRYLMMHERMLSTLYFFQCTSTCDVIDSLEYIEVVVCVKCGRRHRWQRFGELWVQVSLIFKLPTSCLLSCLDSVSVNYMKLYFTIM